MNPVRGTQRAILERFEARRLLSTVETYDINIWWTTVDNGYPHHEEIIVSGDSGMLTGTVAGGANITQAPTVVSISGSTATVNQPNAVWTDSGTDESTGFTATLTKDSGSGSEIVGDYSGSVTWNEVNGHPNTDPAMPATMEVTEQSNYQDVWGAFVSEPPSTALPLVMQK